MRKLIPVPIFLMCLFLLVGCYIKSMTTVSGKEYYVVVASVPTNELVRAKLLAKDYWNQGFNEAAVYQSTSGYNVVVLGRYSFSGAKEILVEAIRQQTIPADSYIVEGATFTKRVWP